MFFNVYICRITLYILSETWTENLFMASHYLWDVCCWTWQQFIHFQGCVVFQGRNMPWFICSLPCWWTSGLFPVFCLVAVVNKTVENFYMCSLAHTCRAPLASKPGNGIVKSQDFPHFSKWFYPLTLPPSVFERSHHSTSLPTLIFANLVSIDVISICSWWLEDKPSFHLFIGVLFLLWD